jgi:hypothetical protein
VNAIPNFLMVREENARQGFLTDQQYSKVRDALHYGRAFARLPTD